MTGNKVVLVTGATSGIGLAIAGQLASDGHRVFGTGRTVTGAGGGGVAAKGVAMLSLDVCSDDSVRGCVAAVLAQAGRIDVLVNNAGYLLAGAIEEATIEQAKAQFETNFFGIVRMVKAVLPTMRAQRGGQIVNMSSLAGLVPVPFWGFYNASKFAVEGYSETLRIELKPLGIWVSLVEPGTIKTAFYAQSAAVPIPEYSPWRDRGLATLKGFSEKAPGPDVVAHVVSKLVKSSRPRLRYAVTAEATYFPLMRRFLPAGLFESGERVAFHLDR
jgi:NAD(P)-dependent dehydrogenase (short-subunit alcohol dehydrogenase family)